MMSTIGTATILGAGLLGGSLGMALRKRDIAKTIRVWSPSASTRNTCKKTVWCDKVLDEATAACVGADLVFLCGPVDRIPALMKEIAPFCRKEALVTDVGSTKKSICEAGEQFFPGVNGPLFVGSHPMAGSEKSGIRFASAELFEGKTCILTPVNHSRQKVESLGGVWRALGMNLFECSPEEHDQIVAHMSHLPHAFSAVLSKTLQSSPSSWLESAGEGLKDTTRIAAGDPSLWSAIFLENRIAVLDAISSASDALEEFCKALAQSDREKLTQFLTHGKEFRTLLEGRIDANE